MEEEKDDGDEGSSRSNRDGDSDEEGSKKTGPDDYFKRIARVSGRILEAKNLVNTDTWGKSDPYCVVKGIRSNNHLVQIYKTKRIDDNLSPQWMEDFVFDCPTSWGLNALVGLKFFVYDSDDKITSEIGSDDFLGGADLDLYDAPHNRPVSHTLELGGIEVQKQVKIKKRKSLLCVQIKVTHEVMLKPPPPAQQVLNTLHTVQFISGIECHIARARHLRNADVLGRSDPVCIVRAVTISGEVRELYRTNVIDDSLNPEWDEDFVKRWGDGDDPGDQPVMLIFDIYDADDDDEDVAASGDHLGSGMVALWEFPTGVKRKKRLELQGESQLLETMLTKDGRPRDRSGVFDGGPIAKKESNASDGKAEKGKDGGRGFKGFLTHMVARMKSIKITSVSSKSALLFEITVHRTEKKMPHSALFKAPVEVREEEDVEYLMSLPDWRQGLFRPPTQLRRDFEDGGRPRLATLRAKDKVVFIYGVVRGATGLPSTDLLGKSDPYCIVEAQTIGSQKIFVHRTRVIQDRLCPAWQESFFFVVPERIIVQRLNFYVYDSDESVFDMGEIAVEGLNNSDDSLGQTSVDLGSVCNGDRICEDIPLTGCKAVRSLMPKDTASTAFRRFSTISVEIRVERRACPTYDVRKDQREWQPRPRHTVTVDPPIHRIYVDPSQQAVPAPSYEHTARRVVRLYKANRLSAMNKDRFRDSAWLQHLDKGPWRSLADGQRRRKTAAEADEAESEGEEADSEEEEKRIQTRREEMALNGPDELHELARARRSGVPAASRSMSLPSLHTQFGRKAGPQARTFAARRPEWVDALSFVGGAPAGAAARGVCRRPPLAALTCVGV